MIELVTLVDTTGYHLSFVCVYMRESECERRGHSQSVLRI